MGGHGGIARADVSVARSSRRHTVASFTASVASPYAHFLPRSFAASVIAF